MSETNMDSYIEGKFVIYNRCLLFNIYCLLELTFTKAFNLNTNYSYRNV